MNKISKFLVVIIFIVLIPRSGSTTIILANSDSGEETETNNGLVYQTMPAEYP